ncbi:hypothetical protein C8Q80DRAFT_1270057 [Daedaleopsis nitida]|nr:hypothetical protein C8Q80DRAFT_1270057 [Daedaleopsis nitida]
MKLATLLSVIVTVAVASTGADADDPSLVPPFGVVRGTDVNGDGACDGVYGPSGLPVTIPCFCPPDRQAFLDSLNANVAAGHVVNKPTIAVAWPTGGAKRDQQARIEALIDTLQNLNGAGVGCPVESTNFGIIEDLACTSAPADLRRSSCCSSNAALNLK